MKVAANILLTLSMVNGNHIVSKTSENAFCVARFMHSDMPVYRGYEEPFICNQISERKPEPLSMTRNDCHHGDFLPKLKFKISVHPEYSEPYIMNPFLESMSNIPITTFGPFTYLVMCSALNRASRKQKEPLGQ